MRGSVGSVRRVSTLILVLALALSGGTAVLMTEATPVLACCANSTTTVAGSPNPSSAGDLVTVTAHVCNAGDTVFNPNHPHGSVNFTDQTNSVSLGSGSLVHDPNAAKCSFASITTSTLATGQHLIKALTPHSDDGSDDLGNFSEGINQSSGTYTQTVQPIVTAIATTASPGVAVGGNIHDTATLSGGLNPTGTITFNLYGPNNSTCGLTPVFTAQASVNAGNGDYGSGDFITTAAGTYHWTASYGGDGNNAPSSTACSDEPVAISQATTGLSTVASSVVGGKIHDVATLSNGFSPTGTITFTLYGPNDSTCSLTPAFTAPVTVNAGNGSYGSGDYAPTALGTYRWIASYGGDGNNAGATTVCNDANELVVVTKGSPSLTTTASASVAVGGTIADTAHLSGGIAPTGTITFKLYGRGNTTCAGGPVFTSAVSVTAGNADYVSANFATAVPGTYRWTASYGGDGNNASVATACNDPNELVVVSKASPSLTTTASARWRWAVRSATPDT